MQKELIRTQLCLFFLRRQIVSACLYHLSTEKTKELLVGVTIPLHNSCKFRSGKKILLSRILLLRCDSSKQMLRHVLNPEYKLYKSILFLSFMLIYSFLISLFTFYYVKQYETFVLYFLFLSLPYLTFRLSDQGFDAWVHCRITNL